MVLNDRPDKPIETLYYEYVGVCPKCKVKASFFLLDNDVEAGDVTCHDCSYKGLCTLKLKGRIKKYLTVTKLKNPNIIDKY